MQVSTDIYIYIDTTFSLSRHRHTSPMLINRLQRTPIQRLPLNISQSPQRTLRCSRVPNSCNHVLQ